MFGISFSELLLIGVVALLVFGPERLPEVLRMVGKLTGQLRKTSDQLRRELYSSVYQPAQREMSELSGEVSRLKSEFRLSPAVILDPSCPDTIAKRTQALDSSKAQILPAHVPVEETTLATRKSPAPVVDIPIPLPPQTAQGGSK
jgi:sec-independent protein translocase protein TatB